MPQYGLKALPKPKCGNLRQLTVNASCRKLRVPSRGRGHHVLVLEYSDGKRSRLHFDTIDSTCDLRVKTYDACHDGV